MGTICCIGKPLIFESIPSLRFIVAELSTKLNLLSCTTLLHITQAHNNIPKRLLRRDELLSALCLPLLYLIRNPWRRSEAECRNNFSQTFWKASKVLQYTKSYVPKGNFSSIFSAP